MILGAAEGKRNAQIARDLGVCVDTVRKWRMHWLGMQAVSLEDLDISARLADVPRPGRPSQITAEQTCQMIALACEQPKERPISHWTGREIAEEVMARGIVPKISARHAERRVQKKDLQPHLIRYWLTPPDDPQREGTIKTICTVYHDAPALAKQGERTVSTDELTGVQAAYAQAPRIAAASGKSGAA
jgi:transposase